MKYNIYKQQYPKNHQNHKESYKMFCSKYPTSSLIRMSNCMQMCLPPFLPQPIPSPQHPRTHTHTQKLKSGEDGFFHTFATSWTEGETLQVCPTLQLLDMSICCVCPGFCAAEFRSSEGTYKLHCISVFAFITRVEFVYEAFRLYYKLWEKHVRG
jgi:hypothetical protein